MLEQLRTRYVLMFVVVGTLLGIADPVAAVEVSFPDANLKAVVRSELGIPAPTPITDTDMETLGWLDAHDSNISNIEGLEYATNLTTLSLHENQIVDISPVTGLSSLKALELGNNHISNISAVTGLTNLWVLLLADNQIETMNLGSANLPSLVICDIASNPLANVLLADAALSQTSFNTIMDGGHLTYTGIAELPGVLNLDMSGVDFAGIPDLSTMYSADDLEQLSLAGATNLGGTQVVPLTVELDSLNWLDVTGPWDSFDAGTQSSLNAWDAVEGNTLVFSEPSTLVSIDIKPGSDPNSINPGSNGNIPVVIFGADTFDVTTVDLTTVMLADAGIKARGKKGDLMSSFEDVDGDGLLDLIIHIDTQGLVLGDDDVEAHLTGETFDGFPIFGTDAIRLVGSSGGQPTTAFTSEDAPLSAASSVPEPSTIALLSLGVLGLLFIRRR